MNHHERRARDLAHENDRLRERLSAAQIRAARLEACLEGLYKDAKLFLADPGQRWKRNVLAGAIEHARKVRWGGNEEARREGSAPDGPEVGAAHEAPATTEKLTEVGR